MDIKEIALKVADSLRNKVDGISHMQSNQGLVAFAEALIAELAKQNVPCAFLHEWIEYHPFGDTFAGEPCATITNDEKPFDSSDTVSPLFTFPPSVEAIENKVAEACAEFVKCGDHEYDPLVIARKLSEGGVSWEILAKKFGTNKRTVGRIISGESYV